MYHQLQHSEFVCSMWISEQTVIISLHSINLPVFITETENVTARYGLGLQIRYSYVLNGL